MVKTEGHWAKVYGGVHALNENNLKAIEDGGEELIERLVLYSLRKVRLLYWRDGRDSDSLPGGRTAEDMVFIALEKVLSGRRKSWDPGKSSFEKYVQGVIKSEISHLVESAEHRRSVRIPEDEHLADILTGEDSLNGNPETRFMTEDQDSQFRDQLYLTVSGDEELESLILLLDDGVVETQAIADALKVPSRRVYSLRAKLVTRIETASVIASKGRLPK